ncbi:CBS domain-containing protein [Burkholderia cenocepacia]|uniref:Histidine kinase n=1 Tax=Burkholderia cenocepacia TaxID=95486 RepID=A0A1V2VT50_9BURK|nr:CBS domain-containing protein [Burkholderia cenocepacia]MBR8285407.1 CBS domain-containing protein [Burkholderia cenocepacia]MBR8497032.1 CBS domain-containing protein [Burkholderia cenocepacia]MDR8100457.1 CBS domain-containing protein [Burkholderia cenocepacia]ONI98654.1 histidine kinase [Burkholderia cenocepacia]ONJ21235.1 histidine kinase [Burkholderia cenocepacia]
MYARDVMTTSVISASPEMSVQETAKLLVEHGISAAPVIDADGKLIGIVSEGDLVHRVEIGTHAKRRSWWLELLASSRELASEYVKEHAQTVKDLMTVDVVTVAEDTPLFEVAELLERHRIKRVPVVDNGKVAGLVSRADLVRALASDTHDRRKSLAHADVEIREAILNAMSGQRWALSRGQIIVKNGKVHLWGVIFSEGERKAVCVAAQTVPGVKQVISHLVYPVTLPSM